MRRTIVGASALNSVRARCRLAGDDAGMQQHVSQGQLVAQDTRLAEAAGPLLHLRADCWNLHPGVHAGAGGLYRTQANGASLQASSSLL